MDTIKTAASIFLWLMLLNIADFMLTMIAIYYGATEQNPIFLHLFNNGEYSFAAIFKLGSPILFIGIWFYTMIQPAYSKSTKIMHRFAYFSGLIVLQFYWFVIISNCTVLLSYFLPVWSQFVFLILAGFSLGEYYAKRLHIIS